MIAKDLIAKLAELPSDRLVCVDVTELGFIDITDVNDDPEDPGALILIEDSGDMPALVRAINGDATLEGFKVGVLSENPKVKDVHLTLQARDTLSLSTSDGRHYRAAIDDGEIVLRRVADALPTTTGYEMKCGTCGAIYPYQKCNHQPERLLVEARTEPRSTTRTWTEHLFRCTQCKRVARASQEAIDELRKAMDFGDTHVTDATIAASIDFCLACVNGEPGPEGEHVALCHGSEGIEGEPTCVGPSVQRVRAKAPGSTEWFTTDWCTECLADARAQGYLVEVPT